MSYFDIDDRSVVFDLSGELLKFFGKEKPIIVCLGSSKVLSDMVGVFVADILKNKGADVVVFGGNKRNVDNNIAKYLAKYIDASRILFVDSGMLNREKNEPGKTIMFSSKTILNDKTVLDSPCIVANTISKKDANFNFANCSYQSVVNCANTISLAILDYFDYVDLLNNSKKQTMN